MNEALTEFEILLDAIRKDQSLGSARLCARAAEGIAMLSEAFAQEDSLSQIRQELHSACHRVAQVRPSMAEMVRVGNDALLVLSGGGVEEMTQWARSYLDRRHQMVNAAADAFVAMLDKPTSVVTLSNSTTVRAMLTRAAAAGKISKVWCAQSEPPGEGRAAARHLVKAGIHVHLISDAAVTRAVLDADLILVGADALQTLGVFNKVGTAIVALLGLQYSRPMYSASTSLKLMPPRLQRLFSAEEGSGEEVLDAETNAMLLEEGQVSGGSITVYNPYYERVEYGMFTGIVTEQGILDPSDLPDMARAVPVAEGFGW